MKKLVTLLIVLCTGITLLAQVGTVTGTDRIPVNVNTNLITFQEVVQLEGTKAEHFNRASEWLHHYYKQPVYVTEVREASTGLIKGKHQFELFFYEDDVKKRAGMIKYYFKIECKDNRYRYTLDHFMLTQNSKYPCERWLDVSHRDYNEQWPKYLEQIRAYALDDFGTNLKEYMIPPIVVEEEEW
ncbi:MAG: DUF4468 domain-containing protein [Bacteroidota bacterium]